MWMHPRGSLDTQCTRRMAHALHVRSAQRSLNTALDRVPATSRLVDPSAMQGLETSIFTRHRHASPSLLFFCLTSQGCFLGASRWGFGSSGVFFGGFPFCTFGAWAWARSTVRLWSMCNGGSGRRSKGGVLAFVPVFRLLFCVGVGCLDWRGSMVGLWLWYRKTRDIPFKFGRRSGLYMESLGFWFFSSVSLFRWLDGHVFRVGIPGVSGKGLGTRAGDWYTARAMGTGFALRLY